MNRLFQRHASFASILAGWLLFSGIASAQLRLVDICHVKGQEENTLHGLGLVVGLNGTGDGDIPTVRALAKMMELMGTPIAQDTKGRPMLEELSETANVAMVFVTVTVPRHGAREGERLHCSVSAISAKSLEGGTLMMTPLLGPRPGDRQIYGQAQGKILLDHIGHPTVGRIHGGARMEVEFQNAFEKDGVITLVLDSDHASFQTALAVEEAINNPKAVGSNPQSGFDSANGSSANSAAPTSDRRARAIDQMNIEVRIPDWYKEDVVAYTAEILETRIFPPKNEARVVINERNGVIIIGDNVEIGPVAVTHKNLSINAGGNGPMHLIDPSADTSTTKLKALVDALNALKVEPPDIIAIIKELQRSGQLYGHVIVQ